MYGSPLGPLSPPVVRKHNEDTKIEQRTIPQHSIPGSTNIPSHTLSLSLAHTHTHSLYDVESERRRDVVVKQDNHSPCALHSRILVLRILRNEQKSKIHQNSRGRTRGLQGEILKCYEPKALLKMVLYFSYGTQLVVTKTISIILVVRGLLRFFQEDEDSMVTLSTTDLLQSHRRGTSVFV